MGAGTGQRQGPGRSPLLRSRRDGDQGEGPKSRRRPQIWGHVEVELIGPRDYSLHKL